MAPIIVPEGTRPPDAWAQSLILLGSGPPGWRAEALRLLEEARYAGVVFVPEDSRPATSAEASELDDEWREHWLRRVDIVLVWLEPGGDESDLWVVCARIGELVSTERLVVRAAGDFAAAARLRRWVSSRRIPVAETLFETVHGALASMPSPVLRGGVERDVPVEVWKSHTFQEWLALQRAAGNEPVEISEQWSLRRGRYRQLVLSVLLPKIRIGAEDGRIEFGEVVVIRPDQAAVLLWWPGPTLLDTRLLLVTDARVSARVEGGYLWGLPSGSAGAGALRDTASWELAEETSINVDPIDLVGHGERQVLSTMSAHVCGLFSAHGTAQALRYALSQEGIAHGSHAEHEFTFPHVVTLRDLLAKPVDWATLGMALLVLLEGHLDPETASQ